MWIGGVMPVARTTDGSIDPGVRESGDDQPQSRYRVSEEYADHNGGSSTERTTTEDSGTADRLDTRTPEQKLREQLLLGQQGLSMDWLNRDRCHLRRGATLALNEKHGLDPETESGCEGDDMGVSVGNKQEKTITNNYYSGPHPHPPHPHPPIHPPRRFPWWLITLLILPWLILAIALTIWILMDAGNDPLIWRLDANSLPPVEVPAE